MNDVSRMLSPREEGDAHTAAQLLPLMYDGMRKLAAGHMVNEAPGRTLDARPWLTAALADRPENP